MYLSPSLVVVIASVSLRIWGKRYHTRASCNSIFTEGRTTQKTDGEL